MFYTKVKVKDDVEIEVLFYEYSLFTQCANCENELVVDNDLLVSVLQDGCFHTTKVICSICTKETREKESRIEQSKNKKVHLLSSWRDQKMNS